MVLKETTVSVVPMQFIFAYNYLDNKDNKPQKTCAWVYFEWIERAFFRSPLKAIIFFLYKNANVNYLVAHPYPLQGIPWRATGGSPFECVDISKYTQGIRRNVWKLRMERRMIKVLTHLGLKFSSKKMFPATSTYQVCCLPYSNKFASIWRECYSYTCRCVGDKDSYLTTSLFIVQFCREIF